MREIIKVEAYPIEELPTDKAILEALCWLDEFPLETELDDGSSITEYYYDLWETDREYVIEHCFVNEYLFDKTGKPIHHLKQQ
ncbi:MAG: hypothetical protein MPJ25_16605 [Pirellulales bacterium]|nr:hypothetical protein [Pirellulales bacterium]